MTLPPDELRCTAKAKQTGQRCRQYALKNTNVCKHHGGNNKGVKRKTQKQLQEQKAQRQLKNLGYEPQDGKPVNPIEALLNLVSDKAREVAWLRRMVDTIQLATNATGKHPLVYGVHTHEEGTGPEGYINKTTKTADLNTWVKWLHTAEDQLARYASAALKAGVEAKYVEIRTQEANQLITIIDAILARMQLNQQQRDLIPRVIPEVIRQYQPDGT